MRLFTFIRKLILAFIILSGCFYGLIAAVNTILPLDPKGVISNALALLVLIFSTLVAGTVFHKGDA